jgi:serine/threonine protein kinase
MMQPHFTDGILELLAQFDQAWQSGTPPRIEGFLEQIPPHAEDQRRLLEKLIPIDLDYRWRPTVAGSGRTTGSLPERPRLEDYARCYPQLGTTAQMPVELIGEEYWVRKRWSTPPSHAEYLHRFPQHGVRLSATLAHIDAKLTVEFARGKREPHDRPRSGDQAAPGTTTDAVSSAALIGAIQQCKLLGPKEDALTHDLVARFSEPHALARELLQRGWLTPFQVNQLLQARGHNLLLGPYVLLERLGEGGAGQVFKARHQKLNRVVALKLIRKELLADAEVVGRFYREIQVLSRLDHPNVVHAYDAGPADASHFLAMEYVEGTDLGKLVKQGPMPVQQACEYIRQAALGLQHAHERGLVHRDIKPHNLIMSVRDGLIKVADLGLARLPRTTNADVTAALSGVKGSGTLTPENAVLMGTADYLAPEQAADFHTADIRADIYSLGCSLYYLLTGRPPFPAATLVEKVLRHQQAEPPDLQKLRPDVPDWLLPIARRMLAKRPEDRYQTPGELADALAAMMKTPGSPSVSGQRLKWPALKRRWLLLGAIAGSLLLIVLGLPLFWGGPEKALKKFVAQLDGPAPPSPQELDRLLATYPGLENELRGELIASWYRHFGTDRAPKIGELLMLLRSPLDQLNKLDSKAIASDKRLAGTKDLVAVFSDPEVSSSIMALSPDGSTLALAGKSNTVRLWKLARAKPDLDLELRGHTEAVSVMAFSPDGKRLAAAAGPWLRLWDTTTGKELTTAWKPHDGGPVYDLAFAPDGKLLATGSRDVRLWELDPIKKQPSMKWGPGGWMVMLAFRDNQVIAAYESLDKGAVVRLMGPSQPPRDWFKPRNRVESMALSSDGKRLCFGTRGGTEMWGITDKARIEPLLRHADRHIGHTAFTPDGKTVVSGSRGTAGGSGRPIVLAWKPDSAEDKDRSWDVPDVGGFAFASDGRHAVLLDTQGTVYILRLSDPPVRPPTR